MEAWIHELAHASPMLLVFALVGCGFGLYLGFTGLHRYRLIEDVPTAKVRSAHQGYVELIGRAVMMDGEPIVAPLSQLQNTRFRIAVEIVLNGLIGKADYDKRNPIYGKKQKDDIYGAGVQVYYKNPFGWKPFGQENFSVFVSAFYALIDANIDFYDNEALAGMAGMLWRF